MPEKVALGPGLGPSGRPSTKQYVTARPESLAIEVLQFGEGFQVYSKREKSAEHFYISVTQMMNYTHTTFKQKVLWLNNL